ncbi:MAG: threonylcarbamoyl-AMP synthase [Culturomica sp.]|jgi:tRNA threonylcarbamoyl adenosine modification protein (Sua5/YciO/YrdC/YwlC family)|nr:threonylcarbamoyl-AMP synthase [Culturomica sp.]
MAELVKIYEKNPDYRIVREVVDMLTGGGVVIYPTDTIYAIGCDIKAVKAVQRVATIKGVKAEKANFSIICPDLSNIAAYAKVNDATFKLMKRSLPGPFTFILNASNRLPHILENKRKTIGIRIPDNPVIMAIVKEFGSPLLTTSVHDDDEVVEYMTDPDLIFEKYRNHVDIVVDGGYGRNEPSTVVDCSGESPEIIRQGIGELF